MNALSVDEQHRRKLEFSDLSEVTVELSRLAGGCRTLRRWSFGQIGRHLAQSFNGSIDGLDLSRHRLKRFFFRRALLAYTLRYGIPEQYTVDPGIEPSEPVDDDVGIDELGLAIKRYQAHTGKLQAHPLFGNMSRGHWDRIHCVHCAHHLSFVISV